VVLDKVAGAMLNDTGKTIARLFKVLQDLKQDLILGGTLHVSFVSAQILCGVERLGTPLHLIPAHFLLRISAPEVRIEALKRLKPADMDASARSECLSGTRVDILVNIIYWLLNPDSPAFNTLWLFGPAGTGKSTICTTVAQYFYHLRQRGAFLFCDQNNPINNEPARLIRTLAYQLAYFDPSIGDAISNVIQNKPDIVTTPFHEQLRGLLLEPLNAAKTLNTNGPIIIIIDGLDECGDETTRSALLKALSEGLSKFPSAFRFLIASRDTPDIRAAMQKSNVDLLQLPIDDEATHRDIFEFLLQLRQRDIPSFEPLDLPPDWPADQTIRRLAQLSGGLFIWASTAFNHIKDSYNPIDALQDILNVSPETDPLKSLDELYAKALEQPFRSSRPADTDALNKVLGGIVVAQEQMTDTMLSEMISCDLRTVRAILSRLRSLLHWSLDRPIRVLHTSFTDFLCRSNLPAYSKWKINASVHHQIFSAACFQIMREKLCFNICSINSSYSFTYGLIEDEPERVHRAVSAKLAYACQHWAAHVKLSSGLASDGALIASHLKSFIKTQFLWWLEVLSLTHAVPIAPSALRESAQWIKVSLSGDISLIYSSSL
jgi:hypothetical protein